MDIELTRDMSYLGVSVVKITLYRKNEPAAIERNARKGYPTLKRRAANRALIDIGP